MPSFRVPTVSAAYSVAGQGARHPCQYIVTRKIPRSRLGAIWGDLEPAEKALDALRDLPSSAYFGSIRQRPYGEFMVWAAPTADDSDFQYCGAFNTEARLSMTLVKNHLHRSGLVQKAASYDRILPLVLRGNKVACTQIDLQRKNIILAEDGAISLVDRETCGRFPEPWEYALVLFACRNWTDDWHECDGTILMENPNESAWFAMLTREFWCLKSSSYSWGLQYLELILPRSTC